MLETGDIAPDFTLPDTDGNMLTLSALRPDRVIVYFYPKDDTPGCTVQALDFTARADAFKELKTRVLGISRDGIDDHQKFRAKHDLTVNLLSDQDGAVCKAYGAWGEKQNFGRSYRGIIRSTFLIDEAGQISRIWRNVQAKGHADALLEALSGT